MGSHSLTRLDRDVALHLVEVKAYVNGVVDLHYEVRRFGGRAARRRQVFAETRACVERRSLAVDAEARCRKNVASIQRVRTNGPRAYHTHHRPFK